MGQAKLRGSLAVRIEQSQARQVEEEKLRRQQEKERRHKAHQAEMARRAQLVEEHGEDGAQAILDEEKRQRLKAQTLLAGLAGMFAGSMMPRRRDVEFEEMKRHYEKGIHGS